MLTEPELKAIEIYALEVDTIIAYTKFEQSK